MEYRIADDLKTIRSILNMSQSEFAKEIGMTQISITRLENSVNNPSLDTLDRIYNYAYKKNIKMNILKEMFYKEEINDDSVILFHGTKTDLVGEISPYVGRSKIDFGNGFYCGESIEQTISFVSNYPDSSVYILKFNPSGLKYTRFSVNQEWMLAIAYFRAKLEKYKEHKKIREIIEKVQSSDYVIAPIADNRMFIIIDRFIDGEITDEQCKHCLAATNLGYQYVMLNKKATSNITILEKCFISSLERNSYDIDRGTELVDSENKVRMAMIKYKNKGNYIEEILK